MVLVRAIHTHALFTRLTDAYETEPNRIKVGRETLCSIQNVRTLGFMLSCLRFCICSQSISARERRNPRNERGDHRMHATRTRALFLAQGDFSSAASASLFVSGPADAARASSAAGVSHLLLHTITREIATFSCTVLSWGEQSAIRTGAADIVRYRPKQHKKTRTQQKTKKSRQVHMGHNLHLTSRKQL